MLKLKCSRNICQYSEFVYSSSSQDRKSYRQQTTTARTSSSFLGHLQHSHSAQYPLVATQHFQTHLLNLSSRSFSKWHSCLHHLFVHGAHTHRKPASRQQRWTLHQPPWANQTLDGKGLAASSAASPSSSWTELGAGIMLLCRAGSLQY